MPRGPKGEKRPADAIGAAVRVDKIATGEIEEHTEADDGKNKAAAELGKFGGQARAKKLTKNQRSEIGDCPEGCFQAMVELTLAVHVPFCYII